MALLTAINSKPRRQPADLSGSALPSPGGFGTGRSDPPTAGGTPPVRDFGIAPPTSAPPPLSDPGWQPTPVQAIPPNQVPPRPARPMPTKRAAPVSNPGWQAPRAPASAMGGLYNPGGSYQFGGGNRPQRMDLVEQLLGRALGGQMRG